MTTILRVKRKCTDSPLDSLVICLKQRRLDSDNSVNSTNSTSDFVSTEVVQLVGTVRDLKGDANKYVTKLISSNIKETESSRGVKRRNEADTSISKKIPKLTKPLNVINYQVVDIDDQGNSEDQWAALVDVETSENKNTTDGATQSQDELEDLDYLYDLYYTRTNIFVEESNIEIHKIVSQLSTFDDHSKFDNYSDDEMEDLDEDSNENEDSEAHARTLYPDTDSDSEFDCSYNEYCSDENSDRQHRDELFDIMDYRENISYYTDEENENSVNDDNDSDESFGLV